MLFSAFSGSIVLKIILSIVDIAIVAFIMYKILLLIRGTRAIQVAKGLVFLLIAAMVSNFVDLYTIRWLLEQLWPVLFVALVIIFQPELRRALEQLGRGQFFSRKTSSLATADVIHLIDEIISAIVSCAKTKTGFLLIIERETGLNDYIETGVPVDAVVSQEILLNIFAHSTPLHDGATIIRDDRIVAAACFLPLTDNPYINTAIGTRHRAAIGLSEVSDAIALVVSEETGIISMARDGKLVRYLEEKQLREVLFTIYGASTDSSSKYFWQRRRKAK